MNTHSFLSLALSAALAAMCLAGCKSSSDPIKTAVPARPAGQEDVIGLTAEPIANVRVAFIGLGERGTGAIHRYIYMPNATIAALCDVEKDRVERAAGIVAQAGLPAPDLYYGDEEVWKQICERDDIDLVYLCTPWQAHTPMALYAMEHGKHVAVEVPAAHSLDEIWALVNTAERTRKHCIMLENCCYDFFELSTLAMAQEGAFGEVIHGEGAYLHNLDPYWDQYWHNWRLDFNQNMRGDVYPTHGFGPVCQVLNIHRGDRLQTLVAMDTDSFNGKKQVERKTGEPCNEFANGDQTSTLIRTAKGKTILIEHDVMTPRPYSRMYQIVGTDGYAGKYPTEQYCLREFETSTAAYDELGTEKVYEGDELEALQAKYPSKILTPELEALAKKVGGHGGMDFIMDYRLIYCLNHGLPLDMDVYDLAEWCSVSALSEISLENGSRPVEVPDFTRGAWDRVKGFSYAFAD